MQLFVSFPHLMQPLLKFVGNFAQSISGVHPSPDIIIFNAVNMFLGEFDDDDPQDDYDNAQN